MTAHAMSGTRELCLAAGMDDYLSKPVRIEDLERVLRRWLPPRPTSPADEARVTPPVAPQPVEPPLIDPAAIDALGRLRRPDQPDLVVELIERFIHSTPLQVAQLRESALSGDLELLRRTAHTLKGDAKCWGAHRVVAASESIERALADPSAPPLGPLISALEETLASVHQALEAVRTERLRAGTVGPARPGPCLLPTAADSQNWD
jgi:HPt (histidine-containing phosphotransfer) domain-containing protein